MVCSKTNWTEDVKVGRIMNRSCLPLRNSKNATTSTMLTTTSVDFAFIPPISLPAAARRNSLGLNVGFILLKCQG